MDQKFAAVRRSTKAQRRNASALQAVSSMEVAQIAGEAGFIGGVAGVMVGIVLVVSWRDDWSRRTPISAPPPPPAPAPALTLPPAACHVQGLAFGFIILRVESLAEEGKI